MFSGYQNSNINIDFHDSLLVSYSDFGSDSESKTNKNILGHNESYFGSNNVVGTNYRNVELGDFNLIDQLDTTNLSNFMGWGFTKNLGINPGSEFSTINDMLEIPENFENFFNFDITN